VGGGFIRCALVEQSAVGLIRCVCMCVCVCLCVCVCVCVMPESRGGMLAKTDTSVSTAAKGVGRLLGVVGWEASLFEYGI